MRTRPAYLCERCEGIGGWKDYDAEQDIEFYFECPECNGTGMNYSKQYKHDTEQNGQGNRQDSSNHITGNDGDIRGSQQ